MDSATPNVGLPLLSHLVSKPERSSCHHPGVRSPPPPRHACLQALFNRKEAFCDCLANRCSCHHGNVCMCLQMHLDDIMARCWWNAHTHSLL